MSNQRTARFGNGVFNQHKFQPDSNREEAKVNHPDYDYIKLDELVL